ncbi:hypothetical protein K5D69_12260 [Pseudomonas cichorii]|uniref:hypothetical protein n=1 Tax=Pseudomonas cichorii TaxID=36746 RepID=UPI001C89DD21|nr:hypothetical protein [Pseudomonas cichorii]MBX8515466.1 hypothetical protein [Pseudomonas cichorii]
MQPAIVVAVIAAFISAISLLISLLTYLNAKRARENSEALESAQYRLKLTAAIKLDTPRGHSLTGLLTLSNAGEKHVMLSELSVIGTVQADIGDSYRIFSTGLIPTGAVVLKSGESREFFLNFIIGVGNIIELYPCVFLEGSDSKSNYFSATIRTKNCIS